MWRRLTKSAVFTQVVLCLIIYAIIPNLFPTLNWAKYNPHFLQETQPKVARYSTSALKKDVEEGSADFVGQSIQKKHVIEPVGVFFESVARIDPSDPESAKMGLGRFYAKLHTPVQKTEDEEKRALQESYENPGKFDKDKIMPESNWEIMNPTKLDVLGFGGSWILVGVIILLLWLMTPIK